MKGFTDFSGLASRRSWNPLAPRRTEPRVVASMMATLAWVPGGLGTFEGTFVATLHVQGVAIEAALAATLLTPGFNFWLPMAPGLTIARREMMRGTESAGASPGEETP